MNILNRGVIKIKADLNEIFKVYRKYPDDEYSLKSGEEAQIFNITECRFYKENPCSDCQTYGKVYGFKNKYGKSGASCTHFMKRIF